MHIDNNAVVAIHYELRDGSDTVLDSSKDKDPLTYLHGAGGLIPGLEAALVGKSEGDAFDVTITPQDAYGERDDRLQQDVPREAFGEQADLQVGMQFQTQNQDGSPGQVVSIAAIEGDTVRIDGNHPLAGVTLHFAVEVMSVRAASEEELAHGHAH